MARGGKKREVFTCPECETKQPVAGQNHKSLTCIDCETEFAIVNDGEGNKAFVPFFNQGKRGESK